MTFADLALSNLRGSWLRYAAFFLSSAFSVLLFFMYAQFLFHPQLAEGYLYGGETTRAVLATCLVLIGVFAFFFVSYSSGAFLRARSQEFGMLSLLGTTRSQIRKLVWLENTVLSTLAIISGILLGLLFNRLFFLGLSRVLLMDEVLSVQLVPTALLVTVGGFLLLFQLISMFSSLLIGRRSVLELLQDARKPRAEARVRPLVALTGTVLLLSGYVTALLVQGVGPVATAFLPVTLAVVVGTYLVFSEATVWLLNRIRASPRYMRGTTMLTVSQLVFRLKDNARLLATITNLSAVVLTAAGTFYIFSQNLLAGNFPTALTIHEDAGIPQAQVLLLASENNVTVTAYGTATVKLYGDAYYLPESQAAILLANPGIQAAQGRQVQLPVASQEVTARQFDVELSMLPSPGLEWYSLADDDWEQLPEAAYSVDYYDWADDSAGAAVSFTLREQLGEDNWFIHTADRASMSRTLRQLLSLSMFAGLFVSLLFFIGSGSLIYFKLFTELPEDRKTFRKLERLGITSQEARRYISGQIAVMFLLPLAAGSIHAVIALDALGGMFGIAVLGYSLLVVALFAVIQFGFYLLTRWTYLRALLPNQGPAPDRNWIGEVVAELV